MPSGASTASAAADASWASAQKDVAAQQLVEKERQARAEADAAQRRQQVAAEQEQRRVQAAAEEATRVALEQERAQAEAEKKVHRTRPLLACCRFGCVLPPRASCRAFSLSLGKGCCCRKASTLTLPEDGYFCPAIWTLLGLSSFLGKATQRGSICQCHRPLPPCRQLISLLRPSSSFVFVFA